MISSISYVFSYVLIICVSQHGTLKLHKQKKSQKTDWKLVYTDSYTRKKTDRTMKEIIT